MNNIVTVNMDNLTQEEREQLINLIEKSNKPKKCWRATKDKIYYFVDNDLTVESDIDNYADVDDRRYKIGNYFKTEEEAEFEREKHLVYQELKDYALEHNECEIDWNNIEQYKYYLFYNNNRGIGTGTDNTVRYLGQIYFSSREIARNAISSIGEQRIKKYLFGVK